jgi:hypothetical protein
MIRALDEPAADLPFGPERALRAAARG